MKNIIFIFIECLRPKNLSLFGYEKETDKNLKELVKESLLFTNYFSVSNATMPSVTSTYTGKYPSSIGMIHQIPYITNEDIEKLRKNKFWLPIYLRDNGYNTISLDLLGLWLKRGFNFHPSKQEKEESKIKEFLRNSFIRKVLLHLPNWAYGFGKKLIKKRLSPTFPTAEKIIDESINKIKDSKKPFFLYLRFEDTHFPFLFSKESRDYNKEKAEEILSKIKFSSQKEYIKKRFADIGTSDLKEIVNKYDKGLKNIDREIGRFIRFLKEQDLWKNTVLIILGDHGENFDNNGVYLSRAGLYDDSLHTLLLMRLPGFDGKIIEGFAQNTDIVPMLLEYLGEDKDIKKNKFDGKSLLPLIKKGVLVRDKIFGFDCFSKATECVRTKNKKLIVSENPSCYLCRGKHHKNKEEYNLIKDPGEKNNIYNNKSELEKFLKLKTKY